MGYVRKHLENPESEGNPIKKETPEVVQLQELKFGSGGRFSHPGGRSGPQRPEFIRRGEGYEPDELLRRGGLHPANDFFYKIPPGAGF